MIFRSPREKRIATRIEKLKHLIIKAEKKKKDTKFYVEQLEISRLDYANVLDNRSPGFLKKGEDNCN